MKMNSPLEIRKVRLRGLGGPAACGIPKRLRVRNRDDPAPARRPRLTRAGEALFVPRPGARQGFPQSLRRL
jgi:hypothetical protein